jgi:hypothetical protein
VGAEDGKIYYSNQSQTMTFATAGTPRLAVTSTGTTKVLAVPNANYYMQLFADGLTPAVHEWYNGSAGDSGYYSGRDAGGNLNYLFHTDQSFNSYVCAQGGNFGIGDSDPSEAKLSIDQDADHASLVIDSEATTQTTVSISHAATTTGNIVALTGCDSLTSGTILRCESDGSSATARNLVEIVNDNDSADSALPLYIQQDANTRCANFEANEPAYGDIMLFLNATARLSNSAFNFLRTYTDGDDDIQHYLRGDGQAYADASWNAMGADYAEYFESKDGSKIEVGTTVKLDGDKVVACESGDSPLGVVRPQGCSSNIGNVAGVKWQGKYLKDDYGSPVMEEYTVTEWIDGKNEDGSNNDIQYCTDKIPSDVTVPNDATVTSTEKDGSKLMRKKLNPDYDESIEYESREDRDEWHIVGLLGQIPITKGQPMSDNWIKMKDVSDTVEMWFVK